MLGDGRVIARDDLADLYWLAASSVRQWPGLCGGELLPSPHSLRHTARGLVGGEFVSVDPEGVRAGRERLCRYLSHQLTPGV